MTVTHLKTGKPDAERVEDDAKVRSVVETTLADIEQRGMRPCAICRRNSTITTPRHSC